MILAAGTAQGRIVVFQRGSDDKLHKIHDFVAHKEGVNGISWGPSTEPAVLMQSSPIVEDKNDSVMPEKFKLPAKRLVSGGNDNAVNLCEFVDENVKVTKIGEHSDWVRDVAWSNNIGLLYDTIASCSEDGTVKVWRHVNEKEVHWIAKEVKISEKIPLWKVSWR